MFATIRAMFARKPAAPAIRPAFDDIPAHKGFRVVSKSDGRIVMDSTFPTLAEARAAAKAKRAENADFVAHLAGMDWVSTVRRHVFIQNLENGRLSA
ncbi:hypothetical protein [Aquamicrobium zhengzhouense]|uniref:Uncharacterized protein n=1 Tax=Aquamicrobium zhengzhouense TaxID=2781738 RepID=A0ABS0S9Z8_9HYPH|nr:hypothetical protein [Aquamicrobium zhengzhouense]MBI1620077.1 hypothetical protein [Aquamicrobium zhengzhouense]